MATENGLMCETGSADFFDSFYGNDFFEWSSAVHTRGHPYKLFKNFSSNRARSTFFSERVVNVWNYLPHGIVNFSSLGVLNVVFS